MTSKILTIRPLSFLEQTAIQEGGDQIIIPQTLLTQWMDLYPPGTSLLVKLTNFENDLSRMVAIGSSDSSEYVYAPQWILEHLGLQEDQLASIEPWSQEIPQAIRLSLRPLDNAGYHTDLRAAVEHYLDRFHTMEAGTMLSVPLEELGGYEICAIVEAVEPPGCVRLGGEVQLEFLEPEGGIPEHEKVVEAVPEVLNTTVTPLTAEEIRAARIKRFGLNPS